jgi:hypothetical protein
MTCTRCGLAFDADNLIGGPPGAVVHLSNVGTNCPRCGGPARNRDEGEHRLDAWGNWRSVASLLREADASGQDYAKLLRILKASQAREDSAEVVADQVASQTPFKALAQWMLSNKGVAVATWLPVLLVVLGWLVHQVARVGNSDPNPGTTVNVVVNEGPSEAEIESRIRSALQQRQRATLRVPRPGRNQPCLCGSGRKFKRCCGSPVQGR